ncbi:HesA/MoeB/ThiF family protein [Lacimicrobium alkaliphilum]|uniref:Molybdopterin biosynthesis protein MoeB n=1 Tax=Lacimicrobium alkaliphilum TaxID=1526571 RepID=A0ABQ1RTU0_9ALTE|nr:molybdopterin-synthase adenylyltransferase MoeB [Lacimicrobium alkaliphilum]GGD79138.1 molybdopterin biosynthesis protein MoeB [Lacimicrobium alkaliphilum]
MSQQLTTEQALRYNRQILLPDFDLQRQEQLLNARVLIIGMGGLGCPAAQYLVASGVGQVILNDNDEVALSNLQRQILFSEADIGYNKAEIAVTRLRQLNSNCQLSALTTRLDEQALKQLVAEQDLVLDCTDNLASRNLINRICVSEQKPLVCGAAIRMEGQLFSYIPSQQGPCYHCLSHLFGEQQLSCVESGILAPVVGIIGVMQALEAVKILSQCGNYGDGKLQLFDGKTGQWQQIKVPKNPNCEVCQEHRS